MRGIIINKNIIDTKRFYCIEDSDYDFFKSYTTVFTAETVRYSGIKWA